MRRRLTFAQAQVIRRRRAGVTYTTGPNSLRAIADEYGVAIGVILRIARGETYQTPEKRDGPRGNANRLPPETCTAHG